MPANPNGRYQVDIVVTDTATNQTKWQRMNWADSPLGCSSEMRSAANDLHDQLIARAHWGIEWPTSQEVTYDEARNAELSMRPPAPDPSLELRPMEEMVIELEPVPTIDERNQEQDEGVDPPWLDGAEKLDRNG